MKKRRRPKNVIDSTEVMIKSANKMGRHMGVVKSGCGKHKSKKDYRRKGKFGNKWDKY